LFPWIRAVPDRRPGTTQTVLTSTRYGTNVAYEERLAAERAAPVRPKKPLGRFKVWLASRGRQR
jgi:hypothetical protein